MARVTEGKHFNYSTRLGDTTLQFRTPIHDPFLNCTITTKFGWRDKLRILFGKEVSHTVIVDADREVMNAVMRLEMDDETGEITLAPTVAKVASS